MILKRISPVSILPEFLAKRVKPACYTDAMHAGSTENRIADSIFNLKTTLIMSAFSIIYFVDILWRSSRKPFWFDELFTVYLCSLPTMRQTWTAVQHGADFNPPLFYVLTRASQAVFGNSNIATRLPQTFGVWLFCLCLFIFTARRCGRVAGFIAAVFPLLTLVEYYAYEARPHGITLGWCGLALICWQRIVEGKPKFYWHLGFIAVMLCSVMTHVYAVYLFFPFALCEVYHLVHFRKLHRSIITGVAIAFAAALPVYLPLMRTYKSIMPAAIRPPGGVVASLLRSAQESLGMSIAVLLFFICTVAWVTGRIRPGSKGEIASEKRSLLRIEWMLACCFISLPLFGLAGTRLSHAGYFDRYFLSWIAGIAILLAAASIHSGRRFRSGLAVAMLASLLLCQNLLAVAFDALRGREDDLIEPSSKLSFIANPETAIGQNIYFLDRHPELPILDISAPTYIYLYRYAPREIVSRIYFGADSSKDSFLVSYQRLASWAELPLQLRTIPEFLDQHERFYTYESSDTVINGCTTCQDLFLARGYALVSRANTIDGVINEYSKQ